MKTNNFNNPVYAITHNDLDGIGCAILLEKVFPRIQTLSIDYTQIKGAIPVVLQRAVDCKVYITDLALTEELADLCEMHGKVQHIDHHVSNKKISEKYPWSLVDVSDCATYHLFKILSTYADIQDYAPFVNLVNIYDTWGHGTQPTKEAKELNRLLQCIGAEAFLTRFKLSASVHLSDTEKAIINADMYREEQYIQKALDRVNVGEDPDGTFFAYVTAEQYTSSLGNAMLAQIPDVEYALILDMFNGKASLRGKGNIDVSAIAKRCGGGGHKRSAGFILDGDTTLKYFWRCASCERGRSGDPVMDEQVPVYDAASTEATQKS